MVLVLIWFKSTNLQHMHAAHSSYKSTISMYYIMLVIFDSLSTYTILLHGQNPSRDDNPKAGQQQRPPSARKWCV